MKNSLADAIEPPVRRLSALLVPIRLGPLRYARFRWLWIAGVGSFLGTWMHNVAARWTAATLSSSPLTVSAVDTLQVLPVVLLSLGAGRLADTIDRRRLLVTTHASLAAVTILMGTLATVGRLGLPALLALTAFIGVLGALNGPAWQATVPRQVPDDEVTSAVVLISTGFNVARTIGPSVGAWVLLNFGAASAFFTNAASYVIIGLLIWRLPPQSPHVTQVARPSSLADPSLRRLYTIVLFFGFFAMPSLSLLPIVARDALHGTAQTYGTLLSAFGLGAACIGPVIAVSSRKLGYSHFVALTCLASAGGLVLLSIAQTSLSGATGAALCGIGWIGAISTTNAAVNTRARVEVRGRALAFYLTAAVGGQAAGSFIGGLMAHRFGLSPVLYACSLSLIVLAIVVFNLSIRTEELRQSNSGQ